MKIKFSIAAKCLLTVAVISISIVSCKKDKDEDVETISSRDNAVAETIYNDVANIADQAATGTVSSYFIPQESDFKSFMATCANVTHDTVSVPRVLTIDFGTSLCLCRDGRYRKGIIVVTYTGNYRDSASTHTFTFNNYYVDNNKVTGTKTVTNNGYNTAGNLTYSVNVNGTIEKASGGIITWTSARTREWILGDSTMVWTDDVYLITGTASGTSSTNTTSSTSFTVNITDALRKELTCRHFVSGKFDLTPSGKAVRHVDFGTGACDNTAMVMINNHNYNVTLR
ncbi:MAG: hypothetical protein K0Q95_2398 [Bacteroidota bacterium]|jgi:hypothetical protein|nr:hypothetical protein [Bacteroidota bacterium]